MQISKNMQSLQPKIVTLPEIKRALLPFCVGYKWAEGAIVDLWKTGAPVPQPEGEPERRILIPTQFQKWWEDVQKRMSFDLASKEAYLHTTKRMNASAGLRRSK